MLTIYSNKPLIELLNEAEARYAGDQLAQELIRRLTPASPPEKRVYNGLPCQTENGKRLAALRHKRRM